VYVVYLQTLMFYFYECGKVPPPVIMVQNVDFRYSEDKVCMSHSLTCTTLPALVYLHYFTCTSLPALVYLH